MNRRTMLAVGRVSTLCTYIRVSCIGARMRLDDAAPRGCQEGPTTDAVRAVADHPDLFSGLVAQLCDVCWSSRSATRGGVGAFSKAGGR